MEEHQTTSLWQTAFGEANDEHEQQSRARRELISALNALDDRIGPLLEQIPESCRGLTLHDVTHAHQLWSVSSEICGPHYPINPLEGFVLGAAFLIHDAGLTAAAYPGGLNALKATSYYRDRVAALWRADNEDANLSGEEIANAPSHTAERALFDTLRAVHAKRAEALLETIYEHPLTRQPYSLFPDSDLFLDCGEIIGLVAASHHWSLDRVDNTFGPPRTAPAKYPWWSVDALKLACILRTADACAIDERRSRVMPFLLVDPRGVSRDHWLFQMNLNPGRRQDEAIVFHSKRPFPREQMSAWWVAFDAIKVANDELNSCDRLLRSRSSSRTHRTLKPFATRTADGANDPNRLKALVRVTGWTPVDTSVRIENPLTLVERLGGRHLYGNDAAAPLRELIQNASDAIRARRNRATTLNIDYRGQIDISIDTQDADDEIIDCTLTVADDGIGMPGDVLTGALLDFGRSFWSTEEAAVKYPGLTSDPRFKPTGRFGIGFYAIFMIADDVKVMSRPWDSGLNTVRTLHFRRGTRGRAEYRDYDPKEDGPLASNYSTTVRAKLNNLGWSTRFGALSARSSEYKILSRDHFWQLFERASKQLVFSLDVSCFLTINSQVRTALNRFDILQAPPEQFAEAFNVTFSNDTLDAEFGNDEVPRICSISDDNQLAHTRGVISPSGTAKGVVHIGGLTVFGHADSLLKGVMAYTPGTAARTVGRRVASPQRLQDWGATQLRLVLAADIPVERKLASLANLVNIDVDVTEHAFLSKDAVITKVSEIIGSLPPHAVLFVGIQLPHDPWPPSLSNPFSHLWRMEDLRELKHTARIGNPNYGASDRYNQILDSFDHPSNPNAGYSALINGLRRAGYRITVSAPAMVTLGYYFGPEGGHGRLLDRELIEGATISDYGIEIECERVA